MKKRIICVMASAFVVLAINAQQQPAKSGVGHKRHPEAHKAASKLSEDSRRSADGTTTVTSNSSHPAYSGNYSGNTLRISDPTINILNARAEGNNVPISSSGVVGIPKHNYGFANGHLILHATGSTSFGSMTGTGGVQTGSSPGAIGTTGIGTGLNGKSPYAGSGMFGIVVPGSEDGSKITRPLTRDSIR